MKHGGTAVGFSALLYYVPKLLLFSLGVSFSIVPESLLKRHTIGKEHHLSICPILRNIGPPSICAMLGLRHSEGKAH